MEALLLLLPLVVVTCTECAGGVGEGLLRVVVVLAKGGVRLRPSRPPELLLLPRAAEGDEALMGLPRGIFQCCGLCGVKYQGLGVVWGWEEEGKRAIAGQWKENGLCCGLQLLHTKKARSRGRLSVALQQQGHQALEERGVVRV